MFMNHGFCAFFLCTESEDFLCLSNQPAKSVKFLKSPKHNAPLPLVIVLIQFSKQKSKLSERYFKFQTNKRAIIL
jgi:hypothetical protein